MPSPAPYHTFNEPVHDDRTVAVPEADSRSRRRPTSKTAAQDRRTTGLLVAVAIAFYLGFILSGCRPGDRRRAQQGLQPRSASAQSVWVLAMFVFGFLLVPLYDVFCEITGFGGAASGGARR